VDFHLWTTCKPHNWRLSANCIDNKRLLASIALSQQHCIRGIQAIRKLIHLTADKKPIF